MKKTAAILMILGLACLYLPAKSYKVEKKEEIRKTLSFPDSSQPRELQVDNVFGSIDVNGYDGQTVEMIIHKTIKARDQNRIARAEEEVELDITTEGNTIDLYVDGPFRCQNRQGKWRSPGYTVYYNFEIKVPRKTNIYLKTVTDGDIKVADIQGDFDVRNVNGKVSIDEIAGSGDAHTVNGKVKVVFSRNPGSDCSFKTINGDLDIFFRDNLAADFWMKTFHGEMYSDFPVEYLPPKPATISKEKGKYLYKSSRFVGVKTGRGGPEIKLDTLNGDILINKKNQ